MNRYYISGFPPKDTDNTKVILYDNDTFGTNTALKLAEPLPCENGVVKGKLNKKWKGNTLQLVFISRQYTHQNIEIKRQQLGFYHTIRLKEETNSSLTITHKWPVNSENWYKKSLELTLVAYRQAKHTNYIIKIIYWILTLGSPIFGFFSGGYIGLLLGVIITIITLFLSKYADGRVKGI